MIDVFAGETVGWRRYSPSQVADPYGKRVPTYAPPEDIEGVGIDYGTTDEPRDGLVQRSVQTLVLYLPEGLSIDSRDHFVIRGNEYDVEGVAEPLTNMFTGVPFRTEVTVRRMDA